MQTQMVNLHLVESWIRCKCIDYNADANVDDGSCDYAPTTATVEFSVDMNGVDPVQTTIM